jgi:phosphotransferase system  glucose/maltose/N-acetylglucosamine-specific IIC component
MISLFDISQFRNFLPFGLNFYGLSLFVSMLYFFSVSYQIKCHNSQTPQRSHYGNTMQVMKFIAR